MQKDYCRTECSIVVTGSTQIINGDSALKLGEKQSVHIRLGKADCLVGLGIIRPKIIEVQSRTYMCEDYIIRLKDIYDGS